MNLKTKTPKQAEKPPTMTGPQLRAICHACGLKHHWLAAQFDRAPGTWSKYLAGEMPIPAAIAAKMLALQSAFELVFKTQKS